MVWVSAMEGWGCGRRICFKRQYTICIFEELKPIWQSLTDKKLLQKCLRGATQNRNESFNGMQWSICPKTKFFGTSTVKLTAALMCCKLNHGAIMFDHILQEMSVPSGTYTGEAHHAEDDKREKKGNRKASEKTKQARKRRRRVRGRVSRLRLGTLKSSYTELALLTSEKNFTIIANLCYQ